MAGTNDVQDSGVNSIATADAAAVAAIAGIQAGWDAILSYGATVLTYTVPPRTSLNGFQRRVGASQQLDPLHQCVTRKYGRVYLVGDAAKAAGNPATGDWLTSGQYGAVLAQTAATTSTPPLMGTT